MRQFDPHPGSLRQELPRVHAAPKRTQRIRSPPDLNIRLYISHLNINGERVARRPSTTIKFHDLPPEWMSSVNVYIIYWSTYVKYCFSDGIFHDHKLSSDIGRRSEKPSIVVTLRRPRCPTPRKGLLAIYT